MSKATTQAEPDVFIVRCPHCNANQTAQCSTKPLVFPCRHCDLPIHCTRHFPKRWVLTTLFVGAAMCFLTSLAFGSWAYLSHTNGKVYCVYCKERPATTFKVPPIAFRNGEAIVGNPTPLCEVCDAKRLPLAHTSKYDLVNHVPPVSYIGAITAFLAGVALLIGRATYGQSVRVTPDT